MLVAGSGELVNPQEVLSPRRAGAPRASARERCDGHDPRRERDLRAASEADRHGDLAFQDGEHARRLVQRQSCLPLGRRADQAAGGQERACDVVPIRWRARQAGLGPLDRISEGRGGEFLAPLVRLSLAERGQCRRPGRRHGISRHPVRRHGGQGQGAVLDHRARDRPQLVSDDRGIERAPRPVDRRRLQHFHSTRSNPTISTRANTAPSATRSSRPRTSFPPTASWPCLPIRPRRS